MEQKESKKQKKAQERKKQQELAAKFKQSFEQLKASRQGKLQEVEQEYLQKVKEYKQFETEVRATQKKSSPFSRKELYEAIHNKWVALKKWREAQINYINQEAKQEFEQLNKKYYGSSQGTKKFYLRKFIKELKMVRWPSARKMKSSMIMVLTFTTIFTLITLAITTAINLIITSLGG